MDSDSETKLMSLITQVLSTDNTYSHAIQLISLVISMDLELQPKPESELMSLVTQAISVFKSMDLDSQPKPLQEFISLISKGLSLSSSVDTDSEPKQGSEFNSLSEAIFDLDPRPELISIISHICSITSPEIKLRILISEINDLLASALDLLEKEQVSECRSKLSLYVSLLRQMVFLVSSLDLDPQEPEPEWGAISLFSQIIFVANSMSVTEPEREFISLVTQFIHLIRTSDPDQEPPVQITTLLHTIGSHFSTLDPDSKLGSLCQQLLDINNDSTGPEPEAEWELGQLISLSPQLKVELVQGKFHVMGTVERKSKEKGICQTKNRQKVSLGGESAAHFRCKDCNGEDHEECEKTPVEVKHLHHPKHHLQLVVQKKSSMQTRKCFCCDEDLQKFFSYCSACDYAMNIVCAEKPPVLSIDHPKWHEHTLSLFPRRAFLTCNVCALADASSPIYMCPPCDFVVHLRCINLPRVIRISRHPHRISFTPYFDQEDWSCGVCRKSIDKDYGCYSCIKVGCSYAAHSRCATKTNVWDGIELEGVPEDIEEEEVKPFVTISKGIIQHFSHYFVNHHLRLEENMGKVYDDNKQCHACITPIYFGSFYECIECEFYLHEACANLPRKIHHPIHPHMLTLVGGYNIVRNVENRCSACPWSCVSGFFYECRKEGCTFKLHVQCAVVSEPLDHESHKHPLFLTSKPGEQRACSVCKDSRLQFTDETFNCIECDFALCFKCATLPQRVRYKHDKHVLTLSYGKETSITMYWCEACERQINPKERFYKCDEYCRITLHVECLIGKDLYLKSDSYFKTGGKKIGVVLNNHMTRPFCFTCRKRCSYRLVLGYLTIAYCSTGCIR